MILFVCSFSESCDPLRTRVFCMHAYNCVSNGENSTKQYRKPPTLSGFCAADSCGESIRDSVALFSGYREELHAAKTEGGLLSQPERHAGCLGQVGGCEFSTQRDVERFPKVCGGLELNLCLDFDKRAVCHGILFSP